jgi:hypothetical protein
MKGYCKKRKEEKGKRRLSRDQILPFSGNRSITQIFASPISFLLFLQRIWDIRGKAFF